MGWAMGGEGTRLQPHLGLLGISTHQQSRQGGWNVFPQTPHTASQIPAPSPGDPWVKKKVSRTPTTQLPCVGRTLDQSQKAWRLQTSYSVCKLGPWDKLLNLSVPEFPTYKVYPHFPHLVIMGINERINSGGSVRVICLSLPLFPTLASYVYLFAVNFIGISQNSLTGEKNLPLKKKNDVHPGARALCFQCRGHRFNPSIGSILHATWHSQKKKS